MKLLDLLQKSTHKKEQVMLDTRVEKLQFSLEEVLLMDVKASQNIKQED